MFLGPVAVAGQRCFTQERSGRGCQDLATLPAAGNNGCRGLSKGCCIKQSPCAVLLYKTNVYVGL